MSTATEKVKYHKLAAEAAARARVTRPGADGREVETPLSASARHALGVLVGLAWPHDDGDGWGVEIALTDLAGAVGVSRRQVIRLVTDLASAGLIRVAAVGGGRAKSVYVLTCRTAPFGVWAVTSMTPQQCHGCHPSGDIHDTPAVTSMTPLGRSDLLCSSGIDTTTTTSAAACSAATGPGGGGGRDPVSPKAATQPVNQAEGLDGNAAVCFELLARRPEWYTRSDWIDPRTARDLACLPMTTPTVVRAALAGGRARRDSLRPGGVPGWIISRIREPSWIELDAERRRQAEQADRDRLAEAESARRDRERAEREAIAAEAERQTEEAIAAIGEEALDQAIERFIATTDRPYFRDMLSNRTPEERRRTVRRTGLLGQVLELAGGVQGVGR